MSLFFDIPASNRNKFRISFSKATPCTNPSLACLKIMSSVELADLLLSQSNIHLSAGSFESLLILYYTNSK